MKAVYQLAGLLKGFFPINFARIVLIAQVVLALIKVKTVSLNELAAGFAGKTETDSNERRMRRFFKNFSPDPDFIALFVASGLPGDRWLLIIDRTNWEFGKIKINILMLAVVYKGVAVPLLWKFLTKKDNPDIGKKGNSNTEERKELMTQFVRLFGKERIEGVTADREFIGNHWFIRLKNNNINVVIRIRANQYVTNSRGISAGVSSLFRNLKIGENRILKGLRKIGDVKVFVCGMRLPGGELLIVVTFDAPEKSLEIYARRWQIETMFACLKTRGFGFESTHLKNFDRIDKLLGIVAIAFVWIYLIGDSSDEIKSIKVKKHGYRAESIFRHGFDHLRRILLNMSEYIDEFAEVIQVFSVPSKYFFKSHKLCELK